jgi:Major Facilitator Superfamily
VWIIHFSGIAVFVATQTPTASRHGGEHAHGPVASPFRQPRAVWAVAFACVVSFMGVGLVDPILPALSHQLHATPSQVSLLFTSYLVVTAVAMIFVCAVSSRIGPKRTLVVGLRGAAGVAERLGTWIEVVRVHETAVIEELAIDMEDQDDARAALMTHLADVERLGVPATGLLLRSVGDHAAAARVLARHAADVRASRRHRSLATRARSPVRRGQLHGDPRPRNPVHARAAAPRFAAAPGRARGRLGRPRAPLRRRARHGSPALRPNRAWTGGGTWADGDADGGSDAQQPKR